MAKEKTAAATESGKYSESQAETDGWTITQLNEAKATKAGVTGGGQIEVLVEPERWIAEKTYNDHLITAGGDSKEALLEAIRSQQSSLDSAAAASPAVPVLSDNAGDADGEENVGLAGVLPETKVDREAAAEAQGVTLAVNP